MVSPSTLRDEEQFTLSLLKTKAGWGGFLFLNTKRVGFGGVKLYSVRIAPKRDSGKVVVQRTDNIFTVHLQAFRSLHAGFVDGTHDQVSVVCVRDCEGGKRIFGSINMNGE